MPATIDVKRPIRPMKSATPSHDRLGSSSLRLVFLLNLGFTLIELVGGLWTNSMAIISGAVHDLGDSFSLWLAWHLHRYAEKGSNRRYSYGYRRFSLLGALANALVITTGSLFVLAEAVPRLMKPEQTRAEGMALFAVAGIIVNGVAVLRVKGGKSLNVQMVTWHLLGDLLGWTAVLVISIVLMFREMLILDPILSILITTYVLYNVLVNLKKTLQLFLQAVPDSVSIPEIEKQLLAIDKVKSVHHTHVWSLDGECNILTTHLVIEDDATKEDFLETRKRVRELLEDADFEHTTVEIGYENEYCRMKEKE
jgi:cobalt-zinc-cadmium efflux system protein